MAETLTYGFTHPEKPGANLQVEIPFNIWEDATTRSGFPELIDDLRAPEHAFIQIEGGGSMPPKVILKEKRFSRDPKQRSQELQKIALLIDEIDTVAHTQEAGDPRLKVDLDTEPEVEREVLRPKIEVAWPAASDIRVAQIASSALVKVATSLKYENMGNRTFELLHALVKSEQRDVILAVNIRAGRSLKTTTPSPSTSGSIVMEGERIYRHEEQLIALAGAIAVAHADELIANQ